MRVGEETDDHLVQLMAVGLEDRHRLGEPQLDLDGRRPQLVREQLDGLGDYAVHRHRAALGRAVARERQEVLHDSRTALGRGVDLVGARLVRRLGGALLQQHHLPHDDGERVVELVRHAGEQRAHRRDLLALQQLIRALAHGLLE